MVALPEPWLNIRCYDILNGPAIDHCLPHVVAKATANVQQNSIRMIVSQLKDILIRRQSGYLQFRECKITDAWIPVIFIYSSAP